MKAFDSDGYALGRVYFGGRDDLHVVSTSAAADLSRGRVAELDRGKTARVDTRVDSLVTFEDLMDVCQDAAGAQTVTTYMESKQGGDSLGRTFYVGAASSAVRVRLYEKWLQSPGEYVEGTNRVEVQLRPPSRAKEMVSGWSREDTFCASKLTRRLAAALGASVSKPGTLQKKRGTPDLERTMRAMGEQYGPGVRSFLGLTGEIDTVLAYLLDGVNA